MFREVPNIPYENIHGILEAVQPLDHVAIQTKVGSLVPVYKVEDQGRMKLTPVKIDNGGKIKSLQLQEPTVISTSIGDFSAEFVTFYPDGNLRRLFPLNGKLSGYWSEENEYELAKKICVETSAGTINAKPIYLHFYESGELKSITFWPLERVKINFMGKDIVIKTGISFYKSGKVKSFEPDSPLEVQTPVGVIEAHDPDPMGINGEKNSLSFYENGEIESLSCVKSEIRVTDKAGNVQAFTPHVQRSRCNDEVFVVLPLKYEFRENEIIFRHNFKTIGHCDIDATFELKEFITDKPLTCTDSCH